MRLVALLLLAACGGSDAPSAPAPTVIPAWLAPLNAPPMHIAGHVGGAPGGATVVLRNRWLQLDETRTDARGAFDFTWVPAGTYWVSAAAPGYISSDAEASASTELVLAPCGPASVEGRVLTEDERPISGATVSFRLAPTAVTDADGRYSVCVPELRQRDHRGEVLLFTAPGRGSIDFLVEIHGLTRHDVILAPAVPVEGRVVGADGKPLPLALVVASHRWGTAGGPATAAALTDHAGRFSVPSLSESTLVMRAVAPGASTAEQIEVEVPPSGRRDIVIPMVATVPVRGRVTEYRGQSVADQTLTFRSGDGNVAGWHQARTAATGAFEIRAVPVGEATPFIEGYNIRAPIEIRPGMPPVAIVADARPRGSGTPLTGLITRHGKPVANAWICCGDATDSSSGTASGPDGRYELENFTHIWQRIGAETPEAHSDTVEAPHHGETDDAAMPSALDFDLAYGAAVHGVLLDHAGTPVPNYEIELLGGYEGPAITDARGQFHIRSLEAGRYEVRVSLRDGSQRFTGPGGALLPMIEVPTHDSILRAVSIAIQDDRRTAPLTGRVVDHQGNPVAGARVRALHRRPGSWFEDMHTWLVLPSTVTAADGTFTFAALEAGMHSLQVRTATSSVCVMKVEENEPNLRIVLEGMTTGCASR